MEQEEKEKEEKAQKEKEETEKELQRLKQLKIIDIYAMHNFDLPDDGVDFSQFTNMQEFKSRTSANNQTLLLDIPKNMSQKRREALDAYKSKYDLL